MRCVLIGAGGHAKNIYEIAVDNGLSFEGFIDPNTHEFFGLKKIDDKFETKNIIIGFAGVHVDGLKRRQLVFEQYIKDGYEVPPILSSKACISDTALIRQGVQVLQNATIQAHAQINDNVIVNTGAIIEHDCVIESGCHIAPSAIILGGAHVKQNCLIGAGAVILPGQIVEANTLVPALTRFQQET